MNWKKMNDWINSMTFNARRERRLNDFNKECERCTKVSDIERSFEYVIARSKFEQQFLVTVTIMITGIVIILELWKAVLGLIFSNLYQLIQFENGLGIVLYMVFLLLGTFIIILFIIASFSTLKQRIYSKNFYKEIRDKNNI